MGVVKKNPIFTVVVGVCVLAFAAGAYLAFAQKATVAKAESRAKAAQQQLNSLANASPAPSEFNVEASEANVEALSRVLADIQEELKRGSRIEVSSDGVGVMAGIQEYISVYQDKVANHMDPNIGEDAEPVLDPIQTPINFAFGFERYIGEASVPANPAVIPQLDKQRQILEYLMDQLIEANPESIQSVDRELVEVNTNSTAASNSRNNDSAKTGFKISPEVSARVPDAIDTMAFRLEFTGYTQSLRVFLNALAKFDLPIVVRSIQVDRVAASATKAPSATRGNNLDDIFSVFGGGQNNQSTPKAEAKPESKPVITDNLSRFTIIVEFIDIILPSKAEEELS